MKTILIIGSGGREHALGWKLQQSPQVGQIYFAPGNAGTTTIGENIGIGALEINKLLRFARDHKVDLTVVGPDDTLALGIVDVFKKNKLKIFGPTKSAARIEWSKAFAKKLMLDTHIPTATHKSFTDINAAKKYCLTHSLPIVIKADGLALGKGVIIVKTHKEADKVLDEIMNKKIFGTAGKKVVIEEFLQGTEVSIHVFSDGKTHSLFPVGKDHKPIYDGNKGPNTGGMGTIAPVPYVNAALLRRIDREIVIPALRGLKKKGTPFTGCLYPGLMLTKQVPKVLEFNARFGDPETQSYMRILQTDLFDILMACASGTLSKLKVKWSKDSACCIILASAGYPTSSHKGDVIRGLDKNLDRDIVVFHAATKVVDDKLVTSGGRVLGVSATGKTIKEALKKVYDFVNKKKVYFDNMHYRHDIGKGIK